MKTAQLIQKRSSVLNRKDLKKENEKKKNKKIKTKKIRKEKKRKIKKILQAFGNAITDSL